jgi:hypothetical protein
MKLDTEPFPTNVNVIDFKDKKVLVRPSQSDTARGKWAIISDEPRAKIVKPKSPELGVWKVSKRRWPGPKVKPTSSMLLEKYTRQRQRVLQRLGGVKRERSPSLGLPHARPEWVEMMKMGMRHWAESCRS